LLAAIVRTQGGPNYPLLGWPEKFQGLVGACRGECSLGLTQMDVGNALRLQEVGLMADLGGKRQTTYLLATNPELNLRYMATMLAYADRLLVEYWNEYQEGPIPAQVRLEMMAALQNGSLTTVESQIAALRSGEKSFDDFRTDLQRDVNIPKVIPWIGWSEGVLFGD
jgi:hypothetical protein